MVLWPDYRNSALYGWDKVVEARNHGEFYKRSADDIMAGVNDLIHSGIADPSRMAIMGHSYGGVQVPWMLTYTNRFKAAIAYEGDDPFVALPSGTESLAMVQWIARETPGAPIRWRDFITTSAVFNAERVRTPALFVETTRAYSNRTGYVAMHDILKSRNIDTDLVDYPNERHVVFDVANEHDLLDRMLTWFSSHGVR